MIASSGGLIRHFWWLVFFCGYKALGQVVFDYSAEAGWLQGCSVIDSTVRLCMLRVGK